MATANLHHAHIFASDIDATIAWWRDMLGAEVAFDGEFGGSRNVFVRVGYGRLHIYDRAPRDTGRGAVHHVGIQTDDLPGLVAHMTARGMAFRGEIREFGAWRYIMCAAPDDVLLELYACDEDLQPAELAKFLRGA